MNLVRQMRNPVLLNELKVRMRSNRSALIISLYLLVLGGIAFAFIYLRTGWNQRFDPNGTRDIFLFLSVLQLAMICMFTPGLTSGVISGERERQTLSVLLTTNLTATKLIIGKWLSSLSFMTYLVLASLPLYAVVVLFGGVSPLQLIEVFALYLITMLGIGSVGVLSSTIFKRTGVSTVVTYALLFAYTAGTFMAAEFIRMVIERQRSLAGITAAAQPFPMWPDLLMSLNPLAAILRVFEVGPLPQTVSRTPAGNVVPLPMDPYWIYFAFFAVLAAVAIILAIYLIKPVRPRLGRR
ncbi:ABC transporter permease [Brevibacillus massiliensis]|uniref:ABC transporter permease n=1 Tax=Brevibacillus massiliensis TaxID=1118054 RepID=UPI00031EB512|nr:ABC transporter permease [Brevibacillus massiliensis]